MIKCILFDLGGVIVDYTDKEYYRYLSSISNINAFKIEKMITPIKSKLEEGMLTESNFNSLLAKMLKIPIKKVQWSSFYKSHSKINKKVLRLATMLKEKYDIGFLSNVDSARHIITKHRINYGIFKYRFCSCYMKMSKPNPEIFKKVLAKMKLKPWEIIFIDDRKDNVESANSIGINAIQFINYVKLKRMLKRRFQLPM